MTLYKASFVRNFIMKSETTASGLTKNTYVRKNLLIRGGRALLMQKIANALFQIVLVHENANSALE